MKRLIFLTPLIFSTTLIILNNQDFKPKITPVPIVVNYMRNSDCYNDNEFIDVKGIMVHSTSVPGVRACEWFNLWDKSFKSGEIDREVCVHAFVDDKSVYQYLPWNQKGWHAGGPANNQYIGFEICEPADIVYDNNHNSIIKYDVIKNQEYFNKIWNNSVYLCVYLCKKYGLTEKNIICHSEGHDLNLASNHPDINHWWPIHKKNMDKFRQDVKRELNKN